MGRKRLRRDDEGAQEEAAVPAEAAHGAAEPQHDEQADEDLPPNKRRSLVNKETAAYLEEVVAHFKTLVDDEERALLVGNVLEEIVGKEGHISADPICSRLIEVLMGGAQAEQLLAFLTSVSDPDTFFSTVSTPFGSHVIEKLLVRLEGQCGGMSEEQYDEYVKVLTLLTDAVAPHFYEYATDKFATHAARRLLSCLAGREVAPPPGKGKQAAAREAAAAGALPGLESKRQLANAASHGLASRLGSAAGGGGAKGGKAAAMAAELLGLGGAGGGGEGEGAPAARLPEQVGRLVGVLCGEEYAGQGVVELVHHVYGSPLLQALLRAAAGDKKQLRQLLPVLLGATTFDDSSRGGAAAVLGGCDPGAVAAMAQDPTASHVVEVMLQVMPRSLAEEFFKRFLAPSLADLAQHASANFVVQAALAAAPSKEVAKSMYESLAPLLPDLLRRRRAGVGAALVAACGRHGVCQREACAALAGALAGSGAGAHLQGDAALAPTLLCLDSLPLVGHNEPFAGAAPGGGGGGGHSAPRLSPVGCSILIQVLRFGQGACRAFTDSVVGLGPHDMARAGADPAGSRVLEALLDGNAPPKVKRQLLDKLSAHWAAVGSSAPGSFLVETAYRVAEGDQKEAIVAGLAGAARALENCRWGPGLLRKVGAEAYQRDPDQWRRHVASASKTMGEFAKLFGPAGGAGAGGGAGGAAGEGGKGKGEGRDRKKDRKRKGDGEEAEGRDGEATGEERAEREGAEAGQEVEAAAGGKEGKKGRRRKDGGAKGDEDGAGAAAEAGAVEAGAAAGPGPSSEGVQVEEAEAGQEGEEKKKKKKKRRGQDAAEGGAGAAAATSGGPEEAEGIALFAGGTKKKKGRKGGA